MASVVVRDATPEDAEAIAVSHIRSWQVAYAHAFSLAALSGLTDEKANRARWWRETLESLQEGRCILVADEGEGVVGFAAAGKAQTDDPRETGELYSIYVLPDAWGRGIGRALMAEALGRLRRMGFGEAILWVLEDNPRTRRFYELGGWTVDGAVREDTYLDTPVRVVRYRIALD